MGDPNCAALDPIFWLHHANIDRLWNVWLAQGGGRANPNETAWLDTRFSFFDETGTQVSLSPREVLDNRGQLGYVYDDLPTFSPPPVTLIPVAPPAQLVAATPQPVELTGSTVMQLEVPASTREVIDSITAGASLPDVLLTLDEIQAPRNPGVVYDIFLNLPAEGGDQEQHYIGTMTLFGIELINDPDHVHEGPPGLRHTFDLTEVIAALSAVGRWDPSSITITIEPVPPPVAPGEPEITAEQLELPPVRIGRIAIFVG